jgi:hypothetical protein
MWIRWIRIRIRNTALRMSLRLRFTLPRPATMLVRLSMAMASVTLARLVFKIGPDSSSTWKKRRSYISVRQTYHKLNNRSPIQPVPVFYDLTGTCTHFLIYYMFYKFNCRSVRYRYEPDYRYLLIYSQLFCPNHLSSANSVIYRQDLH